MLLSFNLLKKYVELPENLSPQEVAERLTMATVEVEKVVDKSKELAKVVVGKVEKIEDHPNADKLKIARVNIGNKNKPVKIVCGGTNLKEHMAVAVALPGAYVRWHGEGDLVKLEKAKIRGEESYGMICAANEIGLFNMFPHKEMEILNLTGLGLEPGQPLAEALHLDDTVFDIDNKSLTNRPDLWSHYGVARELAAIYNSQLREVELADDLKLVKGKHGDLQVEIIAKDLCARYLGCVIENVKVEESPEWLKKALIASGYKPINNIVDITNYVMSELGQPMHAFDKAKLYDNQAEGVKIVVRQARKGEKIIALDEQEYELSDEDLVISTDKQAVALAGMMGGLATGITNKTSAIVLEAANFKAENIRRSSQRLDLRTDASIRFEKALDPVLAEIAMRRAIKLIQEIVPQAKVSELIVESGEWQVPGGEIEVSHDFIIKRIGKEISADEVKSILGRLGFGVTIKTGAAQGQVFVVQVPSWRATGDVSIAEDIVEEVARIYGYDNLEQKVELVEMDIAKHQLEFAKEEEIKNYLAFSCGMSEVFNYPWAEEKLVNLLGLEKGAIEIANPPTAELKYLQTSLIPNLIKNIESNLRFFDGFRIFELSRVYMDKFKKLDKRMSDDLPLQPKFLAGAVVGAKQDKVFLTVKGIVEGLMDKLQIGSYSFTSSKPTLSFIDKERFLGLMLDKEEIGWLGEVDYGQLDFSTGSGLALKRKNKKVALFEIDWDKLLVKLAELKIEKRYQPLPQFPAVERDIAVEVDWEVKWQAIQEELVKLDKLIHQIKFLSEYPLESKKSLAFRVVYQADRTLKDEEVNQVEQKVINRLKKKFGAKLRG